MNLAIAKALILEDWIRVRRWYPWVIGMLIAYAVGLYWLEGYLYNAYEGNSGATGFERQDRSGIPTVFYLLFPFLVSLLSVTMLGMLQNKRGMSIAFPTRYMTLPVSTLGAVLVQVATRCALAALLGYLFLVNVDITNLRDMYGATPWLIAPLIGILGCQAINLWWTRMEHSAIILWIGVPLLIWWIPPNISNSMRTMSLATSVALPLLGVVLGAVWTRRSGALEGQDFSPIELLRNLTPGRRTADAAPQVIVPFASPGAAVRWAENPGAIWWPLGIALAVTLIFQCRETYVRWDSILQLPWLPYTPTWVKWCSAAQQFGSDWFEAALGYTSVSYIVCLPLQALGVVRRNLLHLPLAARLPMAPWDFSMQVGAVVLRHMLLSYFVCMFVLYLGYEACSGPNIGAPYLSASGGAHSAYFNSLVAMNHVLDNMSTQNLLNLLVFFPIMGWVFFWPICWILFLASAAFPTDLILLAGGSMYVFRCVAKREPWVRPWALFVFGASVILIAYSLIFLNGEDWSLIDTNLESANLLWVVLRAGLAGLAFLAAPIVAIWLNIRLRSHL